MPPAVDPALLTRSRDVILSLQLPNGAFPASPTFSAYQGYCWFRDGAFIADGLSADGSVDSPTAFFSWCATVLDRYTPQIEEIIARAEAGDPVPGSQMLPARYTFDGGLGADDWTDFQLDGYGTWIWALDEHVRRHGVDPSPFAAAVAITVRYLLSSWQRSCYDWWEEHAEQVHVSTLGCIVAGLRSAVSLGVLDDVLASRAAQGADDVLAFILERGVHDGRLVKWIGNPDVDASLSALFAPLRVFDPASDLATETLAAIGRDLEVDGGVYRFRADTFFGGGRWPLLSCFKGLAHAARGEREEAQRLLAWAVAQATDTLDLPEQVSDRLLDPSMEEYWINRWGPVATPLLWSHAMVLRLNAELS